MRYIVLITFLFIGIVCVNAAIPPIINYQGKLLKPDGTPVVDGTYSMRFAIYEDPTTSEYLWMERNTAVQVKKGLFSVLLGSVNNLPANIFDSPNRWFGVKVGDDAEMTPRQQITATAYAFRAAVASTVDDGAITPAKLAPGLATPPGAITLYAGTVAPTGWLLCDGRAVSRTDYPALFAAIGTAYGAGDGTSTFNLPNLQGRVPVGMSNEPEFNFLGQWGGEKKHTLTIGEMPSHNHGVNDPGHKHAVRAVTIFYYGGTAGARTAVTTGDASNNPGDTDGSLTGISIQNQGQGIPFNVVQPYVVVNYLVKY